MQFHSNLFIYYNYPKRIQRILSKVGYKSTNIIITMIFHQLDFHPNCKYTTKINIIDNLLLSLLKLIQVYVPGKNSKILYNPASISLFFALLHIKF